MRCLWEFCGSSGEPPRSPAAIYFAGEPMVFRLWVSALALDGPCACGLRMRIHCRWLRGLVTVREPLLYITFLNHKIPNIPEPSLPP